MASIARGTTSVNPTYEEKFQFDNAMDKLIDVNRRMIEFMKKYGWNS
jgi:hypothetical protein